MLALPHRKRSRKVRPKWRWLKCIHVCHVAGDFALPSLSLNPVKIATSSFLLPQASGQLPIWFINKNSDCKTDFFPPPLMNLFYFANACGSLRHVICKLRWPLCIMGEQSIFWLRFAGHFPFTKPLYCGALPLSSLTPLHSSPIRS